MRWHATGKFGLAAAGMLLGIGAGLLRAEKTSAREDTRERMTELRAEIAHHDELYFQEAAPEISDAAYDRLKRELAALEAAHPQEVKPIGVGDDRSGRFPKYRHRELMLSLDKAYTETEWRAFYTGVVARVGRKNPTLVVEPKYDGLAISLIYERGVLTHAATRGNGLEGDDVTANVRMIAGLPQQLRRQAPDGTALDVPNLVELRGEVFVDDAEFKRLNAAREAEGEEPFAQPRNLAAGTLKSLDPAVLAERRLSVVLYNWGAWVGGAAPASQQAFHALVKAWGLPGVGSYEVVANSSAAWRAIQTFGRTRPQLGFPIDGAVVKLDDVGLRARLGQSDRAPHWAIAYKFEPARAVTRVRAITIQVGRTGLLTPVAELEPVKLGRTMVARASLHNRASLARHDVRVGDYVEIEKAGEIIPAVAGVLLDRRPGGTKAYGFPERCPACQFAVESNPGEVAVRCPNYHCPAQLQRRLEHFASAAGVNIAGLGPGLIEKLVHAGRIKAPGDFYRLRTADLVVIEGIGAKKAERLTAAIARSTRAELWRVLNGLGIPRIGATNARKLAEACGSLEALAKLDKARMVEVVGAAAADSLADYLDRPENRADLETLQSLNLNPRA